MGFGKTTSIGVIPLSLPAVFDGLLKKRIPGKNREASPRSIPGFDS